MTFTPTSINHILAAKILESATEKAAKLTAPISTHSQAISEIILGSHVTYRYILITNLLAKATNPDANPLALQAGAEFDGAFDSRSLCHKVVVPHERQFLHGKLGRSNEPYLNKPARAKSISLSNPVRKGKDYRTLELCIHVLSSTNHQDALDALVDALYFVLQRSGCVIELSSKISDSRLLHARLARFSEVMLKASNEGENSVFIAGLAFYLLSACVDRKYTIRVHPTNQAGSSSNEVSDIDVYDGKTLIYTAEIKDKPFSKQDVDHAAQKALISGHNAVFFLVGPQGEHLKPAEMIELIEERQDLKIDILSVREFFLAALGLANDKYDFDYISDAMNVIIYEARFKDITMDYIRQSLKVTGLAV